MLKIYGSRLCPDCVRCLEELNAAGVEYEYQDFAEDLRALKTFLTLRDTDPAFVEVKTAGRIGIPCLVDDADRVSLSWDEYMKNQPL
jgi:glutaredoxin-related protein